MGQLNPMGLGIGLVSTPDAILVSNGLERVVESHLVIAPAGLANRTDNSSLFMDSYMPETMPISSTRLRLKSAFPKSSRTEETMDFIPPSFSLNFLVLISPSGKMTISPSL